MHKRTEAFVPLGQFRIAEAEDELNMDETDIIDDEDSMEFDRVSEELPHKI
jgi:hypothetical protein